MENAGKTCGGPFCATGKGLAVRINQRVIKVWLRFELVEITELPRDFAR